MEPKIEGTSELVWEISVIINAASSTEDWISIKKKKKIYANGFLFLYTQDYYAIREDIFKQTWYNLSNV